jgi:hypothetical protein
MLAAVREGWWFLFWSDDDDDDDVQEEEDASDGVADAVPVVGGQQGCGVDGCT